jgi:ATP-binding cassette subfamily F protein 3
VKSFDGDLGDYRRRVLSDRSDDAESRTERPAKPRRNSEPSKTPAEPRPAPKPLRKRVERAEAEIARLTAEIEKLDAALADGGLFARDALKAAALAKARAEYAAALTIAEEDWLAAGAALEAASS